MKRYLLSLLIAFGLCLTSCSVLRDLFGDIRDAVDEACRRGVPIVAGDVSDGRAQVRLCTDADRCQLRDAIYTANVCSTVFFPDHDVTLSCDADAPEAVTVQLLGHQSYAIMGPLPAVTGRIRVEGRGAKIAMETGHNARHFWVRPDGVLSLKEVTLTGGSVVSTSLADGRMIQNSDNGGTILNQGMLRLGNSVSIVGSAAEHRGGAIYSSGTLCVQPADDAPVWIAKSDANEGGGIFSSGTTSIQNVFIFSNRARRGAGIYVDSGESVIARSTITSNTYEPQPPVAVTGDAQGAGAFVASGGALKMFSLFVSGNGAISHGATEGDGSGIFNFRGVAQVYDTLLSTNMAPGSSAGGGKFVSGGGVGEFVLTNSVLHANGTNCSGTFTAHERNLSSDTSCTSLSATTERLHFDLTGATPPPETGVSVISTRPVPTSPSPLLDAGTCTFSATGSGLVDRLRRRDQAGATRRTGQCNIGPMDTH